MSRPRKGFTLIELLVVIAIIAILAAILFPVFAKAKGKARETQCISNMKQLGTAAMMYLQDYDDWYPAPGAIQYGAQYTSWAMKLAPYAKNIPIFKCPQWRYEATGSLETDQICSYQLNLYVVGDRGIPGGYGPTSEPLHSSTVIKRPAQVVYLCEGSESVTVWYTIGSANWVNAWWCSLPHNDGFVVNFCDGHAKHYSVAKGELYRQDPPLFYIPYDQVWHDITFNPYWDG